MKVLWIVNLIPADMVRKLNLASEHLGGWVESMIGQLKKEASLELAVVCKSPKDVRFCEKIEGVTYVGFSYDSKTSEADLMEIFEPIVRDFSPDIIQIEGTEFVHAKAMLMTARKMKIPAVVSLQGILSGYDPYQCGQLQMDDLMLSGSLKNRIAAWILHLRKTRWFRKRLKPEYEVISNTDYLMGRTTWDRAHSYSINPNATYYSCNRVLRPPFYQTNWDLSQVERHSVYVGNGYFALKGLHFVVMALPSLIREYPDIKVFVAGTPPFGKGDKRPFYKKGYGGYLEKLIKDSGVEDHIVFTGSLRADQVAERLSKTHVYVLCSAIENSPNTLGEAMMVGTPCVAAYVGGVPDMATDGKDALFYRNDDPAVLAWQIKQIFDSDPLAVSLSENAKQHASVTHDPELNAKQLLENYKDILQKNGGVS